MESLSSEIILDLYNTNLCECSGVLLFFPLIALKSFSLEELSACNVQRSTLNQGKQDNKAPTRDVFLYKNVS